MIRLHPAARDERVSAFVYRARRDELQLANLVAAKPKRYRVVTLDEERRPSVQRGAQPSQLVERGRSRPERQTRQRFEAGDRCTAGGARRSQNR
jgi:hypothetical protein